MQADRFSAATETLFDDFMNAAVIFDALSQAQLDVMTDSLAKCSIAEREQRMKQQIFLQLPAGRRVMIYNLKSRPELNGCFGYVLDLRDRLRVGVQFPHSQLSIALNNVRLAGPLPVLPRDMWALVLGHVPVWQRERIIRVSHEWRVVIQSMPVRCLLLTVHKAALVGGVLFKDSEEYKQARDALASPVGVLPVSADELRRIPDAWLAHVECVLIEEIPVEKVTPELPKPYDDTIYSERYRHACQRMLPMIEALSRRRFPRLSSLWFDLSPLGYEAPTAYNMAPTALPPNLHVHEQVARRARAAEHMFFEWLLTHMPNLVRLPLQLGSFVSERFVRWWDRRHHGFWWDPLVTAADVALPKLRWLRGGFLCGDARKLDNLPSILQGSPQIEVLLGARLDSIQHFGLLGRLPRLRNLDLDLPTFQGRPGWLRELCMLLPPWLEHLILRWDSADAMSAEEWSSLSRLSNLRGLHVEMDSCKYTDAFGVEEIQQHLQRLLPAADVVVTDLEDSDPPVPEWATVTMTDFLRDFTAEL